MKFAAALCFIVPTAFAVEPEVRPAVVVTESARTYHDVLAVLPATVNLSQAHHWSQAEKNAANSILKAQLVDTERRATMRFKVHGVSHWKTLTVWAHRPEDEPYAIRVFVGEWKDPNFLPKLATLKPGDLIEMRGVLSKVLFEDLWNTDSLSICMKDGSFTKLQADGQPAPAPSKIDLNIVSASYGAAGKSANVIERVQALLGEPGAVFTAEPHWLGADPKPGTNKTLTLVYTFDGEQREFSTREGGRVSAAILAKAK
jgi:hypothetical protein